MESAAGFEPANNRVATCPLKPGLGTRPLAESVGTRTLTNCFGDSYATITLPTYKWWTNKDLNLEPTGYEPVAPTIVLLVQMVPPDGIEPSSLGFSDPRSDLISYSGIWSEGLDSNQRVSNVMDLQSTAIAAMLPSDINGGPGGI